MLLLVIIVMLINSNGSTEAFMGNSNNNNNNIMERPVKLRIHKQAVQKVRTLIPKEDKNAKNAKKDPTWLLQEYMQLPAAQYACVPLPIKASLERVYGQSDEFALQVPTIRFPISTKTGDIEITPTVRVKVRVEPDRVIIRSISCSIEGSPAVEEWKLNDRYDLDVCATLTWEKQRQGLLHFLNDDDRGDDDEEEDDDDDDDQYDHDMGASSKSQTVSSSFHRLGNKSKTLKRDSRRATAASASSSSPASSPLASSLESDPDCLVRMDPNSQDIIRIKTDLAIDVYPPNVKRIKMIPKRLLAKIGNSVMNYVVGLLLEAFLQGLQEDYEKWACDGAYRTKRRLLEEELQLELKALAESRRKKKEQEERQLRRQEQRRRRQQPPRPANRNDDGDGGGRGGANNPAFPFHHHLPVGFLQRRRDAATAAAAVGTLPNRPNLRRGERIIRLIRRTNRSVVG